MDCGAVEQLTGWLQPQALPLALKTWRHGVSLVSVWSMHDLQSCGTHYAMNSRIWLLPIFQQGNWTPTSRWMHMRPTVTSNLYPEGNFQPPSCTPSKTWRMVTTGDLSSEISATVVNNSTRLAPCIGSARLTKKVLPVPQSWASLHASIPLGTLSAAQQKNWHREALPPTCKVRPGWRRSGRAGDT